MFLPILLVIYHRETMHGGGGQWTLPRYTVMWVYYMYILCNMKTGSSGVCDHLPCVLQVIQISSLVGVYMSIIINSVFIKGMVRLHPLKIGFM